MLLYPARAMLAMTGRQAGVTIVSTNPFFLPHLVTAARFLHRKRVIALIYDLYPDALEGSGIVPPGGVVAKLATASNRALFRHADGVAFIGSKMADHARARYGEPRRWIVLETGADSREFASHRAARVATDGLDAWRQGAVLFAYVGNMGALHDWETFADGIKLVAASPVASRARFLVAASGANLPRLREACRPFGDLVRFRDPMDDSEWATVMPTVDVALVTLKPEANRTSIPSKTFSAMAAGSAVLAVAPADSDLGDIVRFHQCGIRVDPGNASRFATAVAELAGSPDVLLRLKRASVEAIRRHYDMPALAARWMRFFEEVGV